MRKESPRHSSLPCNLLEIDLHYDGYYQVESTGATVTLESSISLLYFYCSRLPSDRYFKPTPRWDNETCTLPKSCLIPYVRVEGNAKILKRIACFEACKQSLQKKAKELSAEGETFTPSYVERALWSCAIKAKLSSSQSDPDPKATDKTKNPKRKRKR